MFEDITPESIQRNILSAAGLAMDTREGSFAADLVAPIALELWKCYQSMNTIVPVAFVDETSGVYLERRCAEFGITRKEGSKASAELFLSGAVGTIVPAGTVFITAGGLEFELREGVTLLDGEGSGTIDAAQIGAEYNVEAEALTQMITSIQGLENWNSGPAAGGTDPETDAELSARLYLHLQKPATSGNAFHYEQWALEVDGIGACRVAPLWAGPGTVRVLAAGPDMGPVDETVIDACAAHIEAVRPIGAAVTVESVESLGVCVEAEITIASSTTKEAVRSALETKIDAYLKSIAFSQYTLLYNRVAFLLLDTPGVIDYTSLTVNGGTENIEIGADQVPVLEEVCVT